MQVTYKRSLTDQELVQHLLAQDHVVLKVPGLRWQEVERQVERLGFGESFVVAETRSSRGQSCRIAPAGAGAHSLRALSSDPTIRRQRV
jgi:hypothetical protein